MRHNTWKNRAKRMLAAGLSLVLSVVFLSPAAVQADEAAETVLHIQTQADLQALAESCRLDTWSQGKTVVLDNDLTLDEDAADFLPIPTFGGTFDGGGHTINGLALENTTSRAGLFDTIQASGAVKHLTVVGRVNGGSTGDAIGGIAGQNYGQMLNCAFEGTVQGGTSVGGLVGVNEATGQLVGCSFQGAVTGEHSVGGIAGQNAGSLVQCENQGDINTTVVEVAADLSDISLLGTTESVPAGTDTGGIAGFSSGLVQSCTNAGAVGYAHMGYNVGGIVGRQSGYLDGCSNSGTVQGRKDVGGIAGQMEPQVIAQYTESAMDQLWTELDKLEELVNQALNSANAASSALQGGNVEGVAAALGTALQNTASQLTGALGALGEGLPTLEAPWDTLRPEKPSLPTAGLENAVTILQDIAGVLAESPSLSFTPIDSSVSDKGDALSAALSNIGTSVSSLQGSLTTSTGTLAADVQAINQQMSVITNLMEQSVEEAQNQSDQALITDISDGDPGEAAAGWLNNSANTGAINGDGNVAGIVGSLAVEYDFDPEDDMTENGEQSLNVQYNTLALVTECVNQGAVTAKKDYAGGIVGRMD